MIGNADDARSALYMCESGDDSALIGEGATRRVYKIGSVAYKVVYCVFEDNWDTNVEEFHSAHLYSDIPGVNIPQMTMHGDVLAMEYIAGELTGECDGEWSNQACVCTSDHIPVGLKDDLMDAGYDTTWGNIIRNSEGYWLIDMAH